MKKKKALRKLRACEEKSQRRLDKIIELAQKLEQYSYSIERAKTMTPEERTEMLLIEAERAAKLYKDGGSILDYYVAQNRYFAQKYRDARSELEALKVSIKRLEEVQI